MLAGSVALLFIVVMVIIVNRLRIKRNKAKCDKKGLGGALEQFFDGMENWSEEEIAEKKRQWESVMKNGSEP